MSVIKEGWTEKCGPKHCPTWNRRWLVLYDTRVLEYFRDSSKSELKGLVELSGKETIRMPGESGKSFGHGFYLETPARTYKFAVQSGSEKQEWASLITQVIKGQIRRSNSKNKLLLNGRSLRSITQHTSARKVLSPRGHRSPHKAISPRNRSIKAIRAQSSPMKPKSLPVFGIGASFRSRQHGNYFEDGDDADALRQQQRRQQQQQKEDRKRLELDLASWQGLNDNVALFSIGRNCVQRIIGMLALDKYEISKLFVVCKLFREYCINNESLFRYYSIHLYPRRILRRFDRRRAAESPWILNHFYREIWIFGNVTTEQFKYGHRLGLKPYFGPICNRLFLDDPLLWDCTQREVEELVCFVEAHSRSIRALHLRSYESDSIFIESLPTLPLVNWLCLEFRFQAILWRKGTVNGAHLVHLELHRVDLVADDDSMEDTVLRSCFKKMTNLLVLEITDSRWNNSIVLPPQLKFLRFTPSDLSRIDMTRIADRNDSDHALPFKVNWPCDLMVGHLHWPSVMNQHIVGGHEALQNKKLRIWVLRHQRHWDGVLMNVNYCSLPPPLHLFRRARCFNKLKQLDADRDMSSVWTSKRATFWREEPM